MSQKRIIRTFVVAAGTAAVAMNVATPSMAATPEQNEGTNTDRLAESPLIVGPLLDVSVLDDVENFLFFGNYKEER